MADEKTGLPEGTDKVIAGASNETRSATGTGGEAAGGNPAIGSAGTTRASGAGSSGGVGEETVTANTQVAERAPGGDAERSGGVGSTGAGGVIEKIRSGGERLGGQAADKARDLVSQGLERSAEALANVGRLIGDTATGLDERLGAEYGEYARRAAATIESTANSIASKDPDELIDDTRNLVRRSPGVALAGAAIVGFALARLVKTGFETAREAGQNSGGSRDGRGGGTES